MAIKAAGGFRRDATTRPPPRRSLRRILPVMAAAAMMVVVVVAALSEISQSYQSQRARTILEKWNEMNERRTDRLANDSPVRSRSDSGNLRCL